MSENQQPGGVQSVERALSLLELMHANGSVITLSELAAVSSLPTATIHRLLRTLAGRGYVRQLANRRYALGPRLIGLGEAASRQLGDIGLAALADLVEHLGETANMAVLDSGMVLYVAQVPSRHSMRMFTEVGRRVHAHDSGVGKAVLAQLSDDAVRQIVARHGMPTPTPHSIATVEGLLEDLARVRARGYAIDDEEQEIGVRCVSVGVPNAPTPTAISVSGPATRVDAEFERRASVALQEAARTIAVSIAVG